jgi:hypothetical protein
MVLRPTKLVPLLQFGIGIWAWCAYFVAGGGLVPAEWSSWFVYAWQMSSLLLVVLFVLALPWRQRRRPAEGPTEEAPSRGYSSPPRAAGRRPGR